MLLLNRFETGVKIKFESQEKAICGVSERVTNIKEEFEEHFSEDLVDLKEDTEAKIDGIIMSFKELNDGFNKKLSQFDSLILGPFQKQFQDLENNKASHGALLHEMISENSDHLTLTYFLSKMRPDAIKWKFNCMNALQLAYAQDKMDLAKILEQHCTKDFVKSHSRDKVIGKHLPLLLKITERSPNTKEQSEFLHRALVKNVGKKFIKAILSRMSSEVLEYTTGEILGEYLPDLLRTTILDVDWITQAQLLHKAIESNASVEVIEILVKHMSSDVLKYKNSLSHDALFVAMKNTENMKIWKSVGSLKEINRRSEEVKYIPVGTRVMRGRDWSYGNEDGNGPGTVTGTRYHCHGAFNVRWDNGHSCDCPFGFQNEYALRII
eukprot:TRINITY_DN2541_c0_g1_i1.p1 TRINITY_DN2541_c0_g1~~TRINITY_DN2541_c0_g1_i1.p1  ORF type:complete len:381 (+),score=98.95 TRINITY_DN2541_c0_g1_i1:242-1384(+)